MKIGTCKLCNETKELINKSHIISNFLYTDIFDEKNEGVLVSLENLPVGKTVQTGEFEGGILCQNCDGKVLGSYEHYGAGLIFGDGSNKELKPIYAQNEIHPDGELKSTYIKGLDYTKTKLFFLSLLWRSSISTRPFFENVDLGLYEKQVQRMLLDGDPGSQLQFPCFVGIITNKNSSISRQIISSPRRFRLNKGIAYQFHIGRLVLMYFVSEGKAPDYIVEAAVNEIGEMRAMHIEGQIADRHMSSVLGHELYIHLIHGIQSESNS